MVGLSILLEAHKNLNKSPQVINKITMIMRPTPPPPPQPPPPPPPSSSSSSSSSLALCSSSSPLPEISFLDECFLCKQRLLPGKDIYMYKGDRAFCSVECRYTQIFMDEESVKRENCSFAAMRPTSSSSRHRRGTRNRAGG
ncbi:PREDICTED: diacylglycerol kinase delta [Nelumbo nucifera]|uniref:FLZ-type domain-containing protein n=2 Tax=Nelumbo nucifera TaxID=4432 RepID=A0A822Z3V4_NELNU|nr:PREDICTED: diacylglycerol kinase delta [Nelumbo nucifera]DAD38119.1 TPA_asm: hypothetical protein HUJ06_008760 [Nelumbo nucifera]